MAAASLFDEAGYLRAGAADTAEARLLSTRPDVFGHSTAPVPESDGRVWTYAVRVDGPPRAVEVLQLERALWPKTTRTVQVWVRRHGVSTAASECWGYYTPPPDWTLLPLITRVDCRSAPPPDRRPDLQAL